MQFFMQNREPLTGELWYYFSSVEEVYAAQQANCGAFFIGGLMVTKGELTVRQEAFCRMFLEIGEATEAYRQSGYKHENYSDKSLWERASYLLADAKVATRVAELARTERRGETIMAAKLLRSDGLPNRTAGKPLSKAALEQYWQPERRRFGLSGAAKHNTLHGLRKNATINLLQAGCTNSEAKSITGHSTDQIGQSLR